MDSLLMKKEISLYDSQNTLARQKKKFVPPPNFAFLILSMTVDPDFIGHWKTQMLTTLLNDKCAPLYVLALWAFCQRKRDDVLPTSESAISGLCGYTGEPSKLVSSFIESGFIEMTSTGMIAHGWREKNSTMITAWANGAKGGRPKKPMGSHGLTQKNPRVIKETHGLSENASSMRQASSKHPTSDLAKSIAALFSRRLTTEWDEKEIAAFKKLPQAEALESMPTIAAYYAAERRKGENGVHRHDLGTFLNNFRGELDRARVWRQQHPLRNGNGHSDVTSNVTEPARFPAWLAAHYPDKAGQQWSSFPRHTQESLREEMKAHP